MVKKSIMMLCFLMMCTALSYAEECADCHRQEVKEHYGAVCTDCHIKTEKHYTKAGDFATGAVGCVKCHESYESMSMSKMHTRADERAFAHRAFDQYDRKFFDKNCAGCHVSSCSDCHGSHDIKRPVTETCLKCHNDHATGVDYTGYAPRPQAKKYQRGKKIDGKHYLKMLPDVHFEAGMACGDCHSMESLAKGVSASKSCVDCHKIDKSILEHNNHENVKCVSCHAGWSYGEYGTYYMRFDGSRKQYKGYAKMLDPVGESYVRSAILHEYDAPILGVDDKGKISPIRPFITLYTLFEDGEVKAENELVAKEWGAYSPHSIRREVRGCESCHESDKRLMNLRKQDDVYDLGREGGKLDSFWNSSGQSVYNGRFLSSDEIKTIQNKSDKYKKQQVDRWQKIIEKLK